MSLYIFEVERAIPVLAEPMSLTGKGIVVPKAESSQKGLSLRLVGMKSHSPLHFK